MKLILVMLGSLFILVGGVWTLQGFYILRNGFMAGSNTWAVIGILLVLAGIVMLVVALLRGSRRRGRP